MQIALFVAVIVVVILGGTVFSLRKKNNLLKKTLKVNDGYIEFLKKGNENRIERINQLEQKNKVLTKSTDEMRGFKIIQN